MKRYDLIDGNTSYDVCVVGGGIYGAWVSYAASLRGLSVCLIDKGDWASGTSSASTKLIHGGLRYLEYYDFGLVRKSVQERELLQRLSPHRIRSLRFWLPVYNHSDRSRLMMKAGLTLYELLAGRSVRGRRHKYHGKRGTLNNLSGLNGKGLRGSFAYFDAQTEDSRLVLDIVSAAMANGAKAANYVKATSLIKKNGIVKGVEVIDLVSNKSATINSRIVINTAGAWGHDFYPETYEDRWKPRITKGVHLVLPPIEGLNEGVFLATPQDNRMFFVLPFMGKVMVGTTDTDYQGSPDDVSVNREDVQYLMEAFTHYFPRASRKQLGAFAGLRVLQHELEGSASAVTRDWLGDEIEKGHWLSLGGKITSARLDAEHLLDKIFDEELDKKGEAKTGEAPLPQAPPGDFTEWYNSAVSTLLDLKIDSQTAAVLPYRYGSIISEVGPFIVSRENGRRQIVPGEPFLWGEIDWAKAYEMAVYSEDVLRRRLGVSLVGEIAPDVRSAVDFRMSPDNDK